MAKFMVNKNIMNISIMTEKNRATPRLNPQAEIERQKREARLAEALRENLHRRKAQKRGRHSSDATSANRNKDNSHG